MKPEDARRSTQQFRCRDTMVNDLGGRAGPLTLRITGQGAIAAVRAI